MWGAVVVLVCVAVAAIATDHSQSALLENCLVVGSLPLTVNAAAQCYQFDRDMTYTRGGTPSAIRWNAAGGELHFRGHTLTLAPDPDQNSVIGVFVNGASFGHASLRVFDARIVSVAQSYGEETVGIVSYSDSITELYNAYIRNLGTGVDVQVGGSLTVDGYTQEAVIDPSTAAYAACNGCPVYGIRIAYRVLATISNLNIQFDQTLSNPSESGLYTAYSVGVGSLIGTSDAGYTLTHRPTITVRSSTIRAHVGFDINVDQNLIIEDVTIHMLPVAVFPGDIRYTEQDTGEAGYPAGILLGIGRATSQADITDVLIDMTDMLEYTESVGVGITATNSVDIDGLRVYGYSPLSETEFDDGVAPRYRQLGLMAIYPQIPATSWNLGGPDPPLSPIRIRNSQFVAMDNTSVCLQVLADSVTGENSWRIRSTVTAERCTFTGGSIGVMAGSESRQSLVVRDCDFSLSYYGFYAHAPSINHNIISSSFSTHCVGVTQETGANVITLRDATFQFNAVDMDLNGILTDVIGESELAEASYVCPNAPPVVYDSWDVW